eukprot:scaffold4250_cov252-Chaetoceros_neogracile.AAC.1
MSALVVSARQDREILTFYCFCYCYCCFVAIALAIFDNGVVLNDCFGNSCYCCYCRYCCYVAIGAIGAIDIAIDIAPVGCLIGSSEALFQTTVSTD